MKYIVPVLICAVLISALVKKKPTYELFIAGAEDGLKMMKSILPPMIAIMTAVYMARASGMLDMLVGCLSEITSKIGMPNEILPLVLIRPLSGSGAIGVFTDILNQAGADSYAGRVASVICGSTETTFYCLCVYFAQTKVRKTLMVIPFAVFGDLVCVILAVLVCRIM